MTSSSTSPPRWIGVWGEHALAAKGNAKQLERIMDRSPAPIVLVDGERCYVAANRPARLAFRASLEELRAQRIDDFIPPDQLAALNEIWARLIATGEVVGADAVSFDGRSLHVTYFALADVLPGRHLIMFVPSDWQEWEFVDAPPPVSPLTPRELEILQLAANGVSAPRIAEELFVGTVTVNTHFANIYAKLGVHDRAAAVARGIRLGLIS